MAENPAFEVACEELERATTLSRLEARGTIRLVLKEAGLDPRSATSSELRVAAQKVLPKELLGRGIGEAERVIGRLLAALRALSEEAGGNETEAIFGRIAR